MHTDQKIALIGGDARQEEVCRILAARGFEVAAFDFDAAQDVPRTKCRTLADAVQAAHAVLLPVPSVSKNAQGKECVNTTGISVEEFLDILPRGQRIVGGFTDGFTERHGDAFRLYNLLSSENFQIPNAVLTAEAAIGIAIQKPPVSLWNSNALVLGYGRIGKILAAALRDLGARVTVAARSGQARTLAAANHLYAVDCESHRFDMCLRRADVIFNTAPAMLLDADHLLYASRCRLIVDLASGGGGTDFEAARRLEIETVHALGLPGKSAPVSAGRILAECIMDYFEEEGLCKS